MLKYRKSRQVDALDIIIDGMKVTAQTPNMRSVLYYIIEYIDTVKFIPRYLNLKPEIDKTISNIIVQSFADLFRNVVTIDAEPARIIDEVARITNSVMIPKLREQIAINAVISETRITEACQTFIPAALLKLRTSLHADLSG